MSVELAVVEQLMEGGGPHNLHIVACDNFQYSAVLDVLQQHCRTEFADLKRPIEGMQVEWGKLAKKKLWIACELKDDSNGDDSAREYNEKMLRNCAVEVLCARTFQCSPYFKVFILGTPRQVRRFPRIVMHLSGIESGKSRVADVGTGRIDIEELEELINYDHCENAEGNLAQFQEDVFNGEGDIQVVKYHPSMGKGDTFMRIMRDPLKFSVKVKTLDMTKSFAGDVIGPCLTAILHTSRKLTTLALSECSLSDVGVTQLATALRNAPYVQSLDISRNPLITDVGVAALATVFAGNTKCKLKRLDISRNNSVYDVSKMWTTETLNLLWDALGENTTLEEVSLQECELRPEDVFEMAYRWLAKSKSLKKLDISDNAVGDASAALILQSIVNVTHLNLAHTTLSGAGFRVAGIAIASGKPLAYLNMNNNNAMLELEWTELLDSTQLSEEMKKALVSTKVSAMESFLRSLVENKTLKEVHLARVNIGDNGVALLADLIIHKQCALQDVSIAGNCNIDELAAHKIKELLCGGYLDRDEDEEPALLRSLDIAGNSTSIGERSLLAMYKTPGIQRLDVTDMAMSDAMLLPLAEAVISNPLMNLTALYIGKNFLLADGVKNLGALVSHSKTLQTLSISHTWQKFTDESNRESSLSKTREKGLFYLKPLISALSMEPAPSLRLLDLSCNDVCDDVAIAFAEALVSNNNLEQLLLLGNPIAEPEAFALEKRIVVVPPPV